MNILEKMKQDCGELDGIFCRATEENLELLKSHGWVQWGGPQCGTSIYAIDKEEINNDFVALSDGYISEYREFEFINNVPCFKEEK